MAKRSAGVLLYRIGGGTLEVFLAHPGGPFWAKKDLGAWTIPKGLIAEGEDPEAAALRELLEETGCAPLGPLRSLGSAKQKSGKEVLAWAAEGDCDAATITSNMCTVEWPPRSGRRIQVPEIDRAAWFSLEEAARRIQASQQPFICRLALLLSSQH